MFDFTANDLYKMEIEVRKLSQCWSTEIACYNAVGKALQQAVNDNSFNPECACWLNVLKFRDIQSLPNDIKLNLYSFKEYGTPQRTYDLNIVFAQCWCMYPAFGDWFTEKARQAKAKKEIRKANAETNAVLRNLDNEFQDMREFVIALRRAIDDCACINYGTTCLTVYTWSPGTNRRYRTSNKLYRLDTRKTPLTNETLQTAADVILESCNVVR